MNKFITKLSGLFTPKKQTTTTTTTTHKVDVDLFEPIRKNSSRTFPRSVGNDPKTKCKGTKKGATHFVRPAGEGLSS